MESGCEDYLVVNGVYYIVFMVCFATCQSGVSWVGTNPISNNSHIKKLNGVKIS
jgi:FAD synthase